METNGGGQWGLAVEIQTYHLRVGLIVPRTHSILKGVLPDHLWIHPSKWSFRYQMKAHGFSHYACKMLRTTDVACKSYKRKRSESLVTTIITIYEFSLRFRL